MLQARDKHELLAYADKIFNLLDEEYKHLYGVVPLTRKQVDSYIKQYFDYVSPDFVPLVLDGQGKMVAFGLALPSLSRGVQRAGGELFPFGFIHLLKALRKNPRADLYLVAVKAEYQGKGVNALLIHQLNRAFIKHGIRVVESNPELETNQAVQAQWKHFQARQHKRRRCFLKQFEETK
jgi:GNAT superfamily N-acetyltransferase